MLGQADDTHASPPVTLTALQFFTGLHHRRFITADEAVAAPRGEIPKMVAAAVRTALRRRTIRHDDPLVELLVHFLGREIDAIFEEPVRPSISLIGANLAEVTAPDPKVRATATASDDRRRGRADVLQWVLALGGLAITMGSTRLDNPLATAAAALGAILVYVGGLLAGVAR